MSCSTESLSACNDPTGPGTYAVVYGGALEASGGGNFGSSESTTFGSCPESGAALPLDLDIKPTSRHYKDTPDRKQLRHKTVSMSVPLSLDYKAPNDGSMSVSMSHGTIDGLESELHQGSKSSKSVATGYGDRNVRHII